MFAAGNQQPNRYGRKKSMFRVCMETMKEIRLRMYIRGKVGGFKDEMRQR